MPQFELDHGTKDGAEWFKAQDEFTQGYVEAMFFADTPEDESWSVDMLSDDARKRIVDDCKQFQETRAADLSEAYERVISYPESPYEPIQAGRDFWFTRQGHGVGFWDRGLHDIGETLSEHARRVGECWPYLGDDGRLHF